MLLNMSLSDALYSYEYSWGLRVSSI